MCSFGFITASNLLYRLNIPSPPNFFHQIYVIYVWEMKVSVMFQWQKSFLFKMFFSHEFFIYFFLNTCISCNRSEISKCFTAFLMSRWCLWLLLKHEIMIMSTTSHTFSRRTWMLQSQAFTHGMFASRLHHIFPWKPTEHRMTNLLY